MKRVTVQSVAKLAGVSQGTVSRVLTGKKWVSEATRAKVEAAVKELGYVPNAMAQGLKAQRTYTVAALVSDMSNPLHGEFLSAAEEVLRQAGYLLVVANTQGAVDQEQALLDTFRSGRADGLMIALADETSKQSIKALQNTGLPVVLHDREPSEVGDTVIVDHRAGAYAATHHLIELGHRRIAILTPPAVIRPGRERLGGYQKALAEAGIQVDSQLIRPLAASSDLSFSEVKALLMLKNPPTAIITLGTRMLSGVLTAVSSAGLTVPRDISIIGIGDTDLLRLHTPPITSVRWNIHQCGQIAAHLLIDRMNAEKSVSRTESKTHHIPSELVLRHSTASPLKQHSNPKR